MRIFYTSEEDRKKAIESGELTKEEKDMMFEFGSIIFVGGMIAGALLFSILNFLQSHLAWI